MGAAFFAAAALSACSGDNSNDFIPQLVDLMDAPASACPDGGVRVRVASDENLDGEVQEGEILTTKDVCNGAVGDPGDPGDRGDPGDPGDPGVDGTNALILTTDEAPGANCAGGGLRVDVGIDDDKDGTLDAGEIDQTAYVCNGADGTSGLSTLVTTSTNTGAACPAAGVQFSIGLDDDGDGTLQPAEVDETRVVCDGGDGSASLIDIGPEPAGANCPVGGQVVQAGLDANNNGTLDPTEVDEVEYLCRSVRNLVEVSTEVAGTSTVCVNGGTRVSSGLDANDDGTLDPAEIDNVSFACTGSNGADGVGSLVVTSAEAAGANCVNGGRRIDVGPDTNTNGTLDTAEITNTSYVCDGANGNDGTNGNVVLVSTEPAGANCLNGGTRVDNGPDTNGNGVLDPAEITNTAYACDGAALTSLVNVTPEPAGANCVIGGQRIDSGVDLDSSGVLDAGEITSTTYVCDGTDGNVVLVSAEPAGANCLNGGSRIDSGPDTNNNGVLDPAEITDTSYACDGAALTSLVDVTPEAPGGNCPNGGQRIDSGVDLDSSGVLDAPEITSTAFVCNTLASVPFAIQTLTVPDGLLGAPYSANITAAGGTGGGYAWSISAGALPAGVTLNPTGTPSTMLSGSPTEAGTFNFTVQVVDFFNQAVNRAYSFSVTAGFEVTSLTLPRLTLGQAYNASLTSSGGTNPVTWSVVGGMLPPGVTLGTNGTFSGTPTARYGTTVVVQATDASSQTTRAALVIGGEQNHVAFIGDFAVSAQDQVGVAPLVNGVPGTPVVVSPATVSGLETSTGFTEYGLSPDGHWFVFIGDYNVASQDELYATDLSAGAALAAVPVSGAPTAAGGDVEMITWSPDGRWLAYIGDLNTSGVDEVWLVDMSGVNPGTPMLVSPTMVTGGDAYFTSASARPFLGFSPDSRFLHFAADANIDGAYDLFVVDTMAPMPSSTLVSPAAVDSSNDVENFGKAQWSPNGNMLFYSYSVAGVDELWYTPFTAGVPGTPARINRADDGDWNVSPTGERIWFIDDPLFSGADQVFVQELTATGLSGTPRVVSPVPTASSMGIFRANWASNGSQLAFVGDAETLNVSEIWIVDAAPSTPDLPVKMNRGTIPSGGDVASGYDDFVWTKDNRAIVYRCDEITDNITDLWLGSIAAPGASISIGGASGSADANEFVISPTGNYIAYTLDPVSADDDLWVTPITSTTVGTPRRVNIPLATAATGIEDDIGEIMQFIGNDVGIYYLGDENQPGADAALVAPLAAGVPGTPVQISPSTTNTLLDVFEIIIAP